VGFIEGRAQIFSSFFAILTLNLPTVPVDFLNIVWVYKNLLIYAYDVCCTKNNKKSKNKKIMV
jgi:hypothetical protein